MRKLDQLHIPYDVHEYAWSEDHTNGHQVLNQMEIDRGSVYKTIVTVGDKTGITVAVLPAIGKLDLKDFARISGNKSVHLLPLEELEETTGYIRGGCSPIGMKKDFPTYFADQVKEDKHMLVSAGKRGGQIGIDPHDLLEVTDGKIDSFTTAE